jgi:hypothetical protein
MVKSYSELEVTDKECKAWLKNKSINPRTGRKITDSGSVYKYLNRKCKSPSKPPKKSPTSKLSVDYIPIIKQNDKVIIIGDFDDLKDQLVELEGIYVEELNLSGWEFSSDKLNELIRLFKTPSPKQKSPSPKQKSPENNDEDLEVSREELYNYLQRTFQGMSNRSFSKLNTHTPTEDDILNLWVKEAQKVYYLNSNNKLAQKAKDSFELRPWIISSVKNTDGLGRKVKPKFVPNNGWMYFKNEPNKNMMFRLQEAINETNNHFRGYKISESESPLSKGVVSDHGIIGWDVPFDEPKWLTNITGSKWNPRHNPTVHSNGSIQFNRCALSSADANKALAFISKKKVGDEARWESIYPKMIIFGAGKDLENFINSEEHDVAVVGWAKHARFAFKDSENKKIYIYDPWKKGASGKDFISAKNFAKSKGYTLQFERRDSVDQTVGEGSCLNVALMRALMLAEYGKEGAHMEIPLEDAVLAHRLFSIVRNKKK